MYHEGEKTKLCLFSANHLPKTDQISNWFINARRRQLPALQRNAQAESYALAGRNGEGNNGLGAGERDSVPLSDGETNNYDDGELGGLDHRGSTKSKRGSI